MHDKQIFSLDTMQRCSGNGSDDLRYAEFFCDEALARARSATSRLKSIADLVAWSDNVRGESESLLGLVSALHKTVNDFAEFFDLKPAMANPFNRVLPELAIQRGIAVGAVETIMGWLY